MQAAPDTKVTWPDFVAEMNRPDSLPQMNWPNFVVPGPHKTGSTSLYMHLKRHPQIFLPNAKHANCFWPEHMRSGGPERCRGRYTGATSFKAIGEVNPDYFPNLTIPGRIHEISPDARIIIVLRDPVERAYSHYLTGRYTNVGGTAGEPARSFREALIRYENRSAEKWHLSRNYVEHSFYYEPISRYLELFGSDQILLLLFTDLIRNPSEILIRIAQHIGVDPGFYSSLDVSEDGNPFRAPKFSAVVWGQRVGLSGLLPHSLKVALRPFFFDLKKPPLDDHSRRQLQRMYDPDITRLEELLGRKLPELRKSWI